MLCRKGFNVALPELKEFDGGNRCISPADLSTASVVVDDGFFGYASAISPCKRYFSVLVGLPEVSYWDAEELVLQERVVASRAARSPEHLQRSSGSLLLHGDFSSPYQT